MKEENSNLSRFLFLVVEVWMRISSSDLLIMWKDTILKEQKKKKGRTRFSANTPLPHPTFFFVATILN